MVVIWVVMKYLISRTKAFQISEGLYLGSIYLQQPEPLDVYLGILTMLNFQ